MKLIEKLAIEAVKDVDFIHNENRRCYGEGFMAGYRKAREMAYEFMKENADKRIFQLDVDIENMGEQLISDTDA